MALLWANPTIALLQFLNGLALGMNLFITALGLTLVFGVMRVINFAHGALYMLGAYLLYTAINVIGLSFWLGLIVVMLGVAALAALIERCALRRLYDKEHLLQLLLSFALVLMINDTVRLWWGGRQLSIDYPWPFAEAVNLGVFYYPSYSLFLIAAGIFIVLIFQYFLYHTLWGKRVQAAQWDRYMLSALGVNIHRLYAEVFILGAALAAFGGALAAPRLAVEPGMGALVIIDCFLIVIIGGMGSLWGSFWAALLIGQTKVFGAFVLQEWEIILVYAVLVLVMIWRPWGLLGQADQGRD